MKRANRRRQEHRLFAGLAWGCYFGIIAVFKKALQSRGWSDFGARLRMLSPTRIVLMLFRNPFEWARVH